MKKTIFLTLFFGIGFFTNSYATDYYVSVSGSNSNNGTSISSAFATLQFASEKPIPVI